MVTASQSELQKEDSKEPTRCLALEWEQTMGMEQIESLEFLR